MKMAASPIAPPPLGPFDKTLLFGETPAHPPKKYRPSPGISETPSGTAKAPNTLSGAPNTLSGYAEMLSKKIIKEHPAAGKQGKALAEQIIEAFANVYNNPFTNKYSPFKTSDEFKLWRNRFALKDDEIIGVIRKVLQFEYKESMRELADKFRLDNPASEYFDANVAKLASQYIHTLRLPAGMAVDFLEAFKEGLVKHNEYLKNDKDVWLFFPGLLDIITYYSEKSGNPE
jgi:hypothetical protein